MIFLLLAGCGGSGVQAPVVKPGFDPRSHSSSIYHVARGDTLYAIAWRYDVDYRDLAAWNNIASPFTIFPGQKLRVTAPPAGVVASKPRYRASAPAKPSTSAKPSTTSQQPAPGVKKREPARSTASKQATKKRYAASTRPVKRWVWPTKGNVVHKFKKNNSKGIDIGGASGQDIVAAAAGDVVYSGSGLIGYGKLIIIKHNKSHLSAYGHNRRLLVKEGDKVTGGQRIAQMGENTSNKTMLHFEIRRNGKPVDPLRYLPRP